MAFMQSSLGHLEVAQAKGKWDPPSMFADVRAAVMKMASDHISMFGSAGKAP
jgi:fructose-bisphosphate aldolase class II